MKDPCITREQSLSIHGVVNDQEFAMHYRAISNKVNHLEVFQSAIRYRQSKSMDWLFVQCILNVLEAKIFQYDFQLGYNNHLLIVNIEQCSRHNGDSEFLQNLHPQLVTNDEMLVA